jgi:hypothetical protein
MVELSSKQRTHILPVGWWWSDHAAVIPETDKICLLPLWLHSTCSCWILSTWAAQ